MMQGNQMIYQPHRFKGCRFAPLAMDEVTRAYARYTNGNGSLLPIDFGKGYSTFNPFEYIDTNLSRADLAAHACYGEINGRQSLRYAICCYYKEKFNHDLSPSQVCITDGASEALIIAMSLLTQSGGEVIVAESCYPHYKVFTSLFNAQCRFAPLNAEQRLDVEQLPKLITRKTQAIIVNSPSNPHGAVLSPEELEAIAGLGVPVIFDEVYQPLSLTDKQIPSAIRFSNRHFIANSFSKSLAIAGFRLGYLIAPKAQAERMVNAKAILNMCTSLPSQLIGETLFGHWDMLVENHRNMLKRNWGVFKRVAEELGLTLVSSPQAGFFAAVDISQTGQDSIRVALNMVRHFAMNTVPGIDFQKPDPGFLRLNFACPVELIEPGLLRLSEYIIKSNKIFYKNYRPLQTDEEYANFAKRIHVSQLYL